MANSKHAALRTESTRQRYDRPGHLDPARAERLLQLARAIRKDVDDSAFAQEMAKEDDLASELGQSTVFSMTSGEGVLASELEAEVDEEFGGPFVETSAREELSHGPDDPNGPGAPRGPEAPREPTPLPNPEPDGPNKPDEPDEPIEPGEPDVYDEEEVLDAPPSRDNIYLISAKQIAGWLGRHLRGQRSLT